MTSLVTNSDSIQKILGKALYFEQEGRNVLALRHVELDEDGLDSRGVVYIIEGDSIQRLEQAGGSIRDLSLDAISKDIDLFFERLRHILDSYIDEIDELEDALFELSIPRHFLNTWFRLKKDIALIDRAFTRNAAVINQFLHDHHGNPALAGMSEILSIVGSDRKNSASEIVRLEALFNYYNSIKSERMNNNVYLLAIISGVFLPLNLVVGFFGMNTENLFYSGNPHGTQNVVYLLSGLFFLLILGVPTLKLIDNLILDKIFGRYNMYRSIRRQLDSIKKTIENRVLPDQT
ncbi:CorA family divalent cation transporter [Pseudobacteriovorax antillogorgiicola]|uniref:CorA-like Mg2+ transporter protein n=1 Tax=Pseudobacteriovorax antillogorgiicola TaxID=1513793 RepID=A0A1Y6C013_9BACT|nr:CorA family divalent cation transporter [Pseudobacteriovorax antillogorgiicola]TCS53010.1 CorA-like Mg2+ transporter protein [Pseudobacteriovorax antillogorgiicola]SMF26976.1 CorA-like Mg2+ transporter protein [Pseudobacteriovorax antillogorgiicola]